MNRNTNTLNSISKRWNVVFNILLTLVALTMLIPLALMLAVSFSSSASISKVGYTSSPSNGPWRAIGTCSKWATSCWPPMRSLSSTPFWAPFWA